jgi:hypothetical protein
MTPPDPAVRQKQRNFPEMHPLHFCQLEGWLKGAFAKVGSIVNGDVKMVKSMTEETPYHEFVCQWTMK